jgi:Uma2 family endonuclease
MAVLSPRPFSVAEYHRMAQVGLFEDERVELLEGLIVEMSPISPRHWQRHAAITGYLYGELGPAVLVVPQGSFPLGDRNEPQPDLALLVPDAYDERGRPPTPAEILCLIEIADTSLAKDLGPKVRLYARFGIPDYLVVDLDANVLLYHSQPHALGYGRVERLPFDATFQLARFPELLLRTNPFLKP